jgi:hypothetical protein
MSDERPRMTIDPLGLGDDNAADTDDERLQDLPEHERRPDRSVGAGVVSSGGTAVEHTTEGIPAAEFDRRTMEAEGGESEADDDLQTDDGAAFRIKSG